MKAVVIKGDFTESEFAELVALIRQLDDRRPDARFEVVAVDPAQSSLAAAESILRDAVPEQAGRRTDWASYKRVS